MALAPAQFSIVVEAMDWRRKIAPPPTAQLMLVRRITDAVDSVSAFALACQGELKAAQAAVQLKALGIEKLRFQIAKLRAVCDRHARPVVLLLSQGQMSDQKGAGLLIDTLPPARELIADRGYDSDGFRAAPEDLAVMRTIPSCKNRKHSHPQMRSAGSANESCSPRASAYSYVVI